MKKYTKEEALQDCFDLWLDMAVTGANKKLSSKLWKENGGWIEECVNDCPCCEFTKDIWGDENCDKCPINKWDDDNTCYYNKDYNREFRAWGNSNSKKERTKYALEIGILALDSMEK